MKKQSKRKFRIFSTLVAMALTLCLTFFGIFAATNVKYQGSNTLSFNAQDVSATVSGYWHKNSESETPLAFPGGEADNGVITTEWNHGNSYTGTVTLPNFTFEKVTDYYTLHIKVVNTFTDDIKLSATLTTSVTNDANSYIKVSRDLAETVDVAANNGFVDWTVKIEIDPTKQEDAALLANGFNNIQFAFELTVVRK